MRHPIALAALMATLAACATQRDPGWQGNDAHPFGQAQAICREETKAAAQFERDSVYRTCMARHGWTQPPENAK